MRYASLALSVVAGLTLLPSLTPAQTVITQLLGNPGFENGVTIWTTTAGVIDNNNIAAPAHTGQWKAWLDGYGTTHTDTLSQTVTIPADITKATLSFWVHIDTDETTTTTAYDKLTVQMSSGPVWTTLATYSNLNHNVGYTLQTFDVTAFKGRTVTLHLTGTEDSSQQTSFIVDDFALNVSPQWSRRP